MEPLDYLPLWLLFLATCALAWLCLEVGYRYGKWRHTRNTEEKDLPVGAMVAPILGLLAFMLAFTFGLAGTRYDARRQIVLEESNAINTAYLRARLLPDPHGAELARLLREYVDVRVRGIQERKLAEAITRSEELQQLMWSEAVKASKNKEASPVMTSLFIQALNATIDVHAKRILVGMRSRIPMSIWVALFSLALLSMVGVGYQAGLAATRRSPAMVALVLAFASVLFLIADLDRGYEGFLTISQEAMLELQKSMHAGKQ